MFGRLIKNDGVFSFLRSLDEAVYAQETILSYRIGRLSYQR